MPRAVDAVLASVGKVALREDGIHLAWNVRTLHVLGAVDNLAVEISRAAFRRH